MFKELDTNTQQEPTKPLLRVCEVSTCLSMVFNEDCMIGMKRYPDKYFDLAIVDPPYSDETESLDRLLQEMKGRKAKAGNRNTNSLRGAPTNEYWDELFRISKHQIVWGVNWYDKHFGIGRIVWDKQNEESNFSDCELAYQSFNRKTVKYTFRWNGMLQGNMKNKEVRIHPTQKPVALYDWIYSQYLPLGGRVIDTHLGSGSNRIAANRAGNVEFVGFEIDSEHFSAQELRYKNFVAQQRLF